ncbi:MAG: PmoA family protein [Planctomycetes bacterium]|nr:PmoA family protein [Planctomycetota bacterium]
MDPVKRLLPFVMALLPACQQLTIDGSAASERVLVAAGDQTLIGWQYGAEWAMPHWFPLCTPSGRDMLVQQAEPYPHHRAMWIADKVQLGDGPVVDFYHGQPKALVPRIRSDRALTATSEDARSVVLVGAQQWVAGDVTFLDDERRLRVRWLDDGQVSIDLEWTLRASHGPVTFHSDWIHYAWPYLRLHPRFSQQGGAVVVDDRGRRGSEAIHGQYANWVDCSATIDGVTEGVAIFVPQDGEWHKWLVRDYGCIGPRRPDAQSGVKFTLGQGEELRGRVRLFVHRGDAATGDVAGRYREYVAGKPR